MHEVFEWLDNFVESSSYDDISDCTEVYTEDGILSKVGEFIQGCINKIQEIFKRIKMKLRDVSVRLVLKTWKSVANVAITFTTDLDASKKYFKEINKLMINAHTELNKVHGSYKPGKNADEIISRMKAIAAKYDADTKMILNKHSEALKKASKEEKIKVQSYIERVEQCLKDYHTGYDMITEMELKDLQRLKKITENDPEIEKVSRAYTNACMSMFGKHSSTVYNLTSTYYNSLASVVKHAAEGMNAANNASMEASRIAQQESIRAAHNSMAMAHNAAVGYTAMGYM